jgi:hypothetical protein
LRRADHSSKESYRLFEKKKDYEIEKEAKAQQRVVEQLMVMMIYLLPSTDCSSF